MYGGLNIQQAYLTGDPQFTLIYSNYPFQACPRYADIEFHATSPGTYRTKFCLNSYDTIDNVTITSCMNVIGTAVEDTEDPECKEIVISSVVRTDSKSVSENIPIQGADFSLVYSSNYSNNFVTKYNKPQSHNSFNYDGVTLSNHHFYNKVEKRLFKGDGFVYKREFFGNINGEINVVDGSEVYVFESSTGKHLKTLSTLTGLVRNQFIYDTNARLIKIVNEYGKEITITRDSNGKMSSISSPYGEVTTLQMNLDGMLMSASSPSGKVYTITYDSYKKFIDKFTKPNGTETQFEFLTNGWLKRENKSGGRSWRFDHYIDEENPGFTAQERVSSLERYFATTSKSKNDDNRFERRNYSPFGEEAIFTEGDDNSSTWESGNEQKTTLTMNDERFGNLQKRINRVEHRIGNTLQIQEYLANVTNAGSDFFTYNQLENTTKINGISQSLIFNKASMTFTSTSPMGIETKTTIDNKEKPVLIQHASETPLAIKYDADGRVIQTNQGTRNKITYGYNEKGRMSWSKNGLDHKTSYIYNSDGRVGRITNPDGRFTRFQYNAIGQVTKVIPANGIEHVFAFNTMGLLSTYRPPVIPETSTPETRYVYNTDEQLTTLIRPDGKRIKFNYEEELGQLMSIVLGNDERLSYSYYPMSNKIKVAKSPDSVRSVFNYFGLKTISSERQTIGGNDESRIDFGFDNFFRINKRVTKLSGVELGRHEITYREDGQATKIGEMVLTYNSVTGRPSVTRVKNIREVKAFDSFGNLKMFTASISPSGVSETELYYYALTRDLLHRIITKIERVQGLTTTFEYSYDSVGRIASVTKNGVIDSSYTYDLNSNRISGTQNGVAFSATFDPQDRMLTYNRNGSKSFSYNNNGELIGIAEGTNVSTLSSDGLGRLKSVTLPNNKEIKYVLDWDGRRVSKLTDNVQTSRSVYEDTFKIAASREGASIKEYVFGTSVNSPDYIKENTTFYKVIKDHLGSPRLIVNANTGAVIQRMDYNEWGEVVLDTNPGFQAYGFAGGIYDVDTKLVKFGARDYDPETGRWLSKDPIRFSGGDTNLYGYVLQDPVNLIDPQGKFGLLLIPAAIFIIDAIDGAFDTGIGKDPEARDMNFPEFQDNAWKEFEKNKYLELIEKRELRKEKGVLKNKCELI